MTKSLKKKQGRAIASTQSLSAFVKSICDIMRRSNCASALQYVPELTWILFLRILDAQEARDMEAAEVVGESFSPALVSPFRWQDWAVPFSDNPNAIIKVDTRTPEQIVENIKVQGAIVAASLNHLKALLALHNG